MRWRGAGDGGEERGWRGDGSCGQCGGMEGNEETVDADENIYSGRTRRV